ncbi:Carcinoembryonic antigen-related cell adhesion molecule 5 [Tupaia chinensis]|uniref:Carcinoembryonic antigen-related cell adhesion molecule 5 n=1 Tax=Tupaia chinensis TaxID=246437 RepID=L9L876_TUPCH|nr:Carcinoembryonic antigen-related cell adhesion molecule 5 [Tupaia chinensis]
MPTAAELTITPIPSQPLEGDNVTLLVQGLLEGEILSFNWFRGSGTELSQQIITFRVLSGGITLGAAHTGRETVSPDGSLHITGLNLTDTSPYTLRKIMMDMNQPTWNVYLSVFEKLAPPTIMASVLAPLESQDSVTLSCQSPSKDAIFQWYIDKEPAVGSGRLELSPDQRSLTIHQVSRRDMGPYQCEAKNPAVTSLSEPLLLDVIYGPDVPTVATADLSFIVGFNLTLSCSSVSNPPAQYSWTINGSPGPVGQQLFLSAVHLGTAGGFPTPASGSRSATNTLIVVPEYMPQPNILADDATPVENTGSVTLTCVPPKRFAAIRWFKDSSLLDEGGRGELSPDHRILTLKNITRNDTGLYQCEASSSVTSSLSRPLPVNVDYGPDIPLINPMDSTFVVGSNLTLSCFADSNPPAEYTWTVAGSLAVAGQLLSIPHVSLNSSGLYRCQATNADTGMQSTAQLEVRIKEAPDKNNQGSGVYGPSIPGGGIAGIVFGVLIGMVLTATVGYFLGFLRDQIRAAVLSHLRRLSNISPSALGCVNLTKINPEARGLALQPGISGGRGDLWNEQKLPRPPRAQAALLVSKRRATLLLLDKAVLGLGSWSLQSPEEPVELVRPCLVPVDPAPTITSFLSFCSKPMSAQLTITSIPPRAIEGDNVTLSVQGIPQNLLSYNWFRGATIDQVNRIVNFKFTDHAHTPGPAHTGRETGSASGSLSITDVRRSDDGIYTLQLISFDGNGNTNRHHAVLLVSEKLHQPQVAAQNLSPVEHLDSLNLSCISPNNDVTVRWFLNLEVIQEGDGPAISSDGRALIVPTVTRNDSGTYHCETRNHLGSRLSEALIVDVAYGPDIPTVTAEDPDFVIGSNLTLICSADSYPHAQYTWSINGLPKSEGQTLFISSLSRAHSGVYTCNASNPISGLHSSVDISITVSETLPQPNITASNFAPVEHTDSISLHCLPPRSTVAIQWYINGQNLFTGGRKELSPDHRTLTLRNITRNDTGLYQCESRNSATSSISNPVLIKVIYGPDPPTVNPSDPEVRAGSALTLSCFADSNPPAQYHWEMDGRPGPDTQHLIIPEVSLGQEGSYTCEASNSITHLHSSVNGKIRISEAPEDNLQPSLVRTAIPSGGIAGIALGVLIGVALTGTAGYFVGVMRSQSIKTMTSVPGVLFQFPVSLCDPPFRGGKDLTKPTSFKLLLATLQIYPDLLIQYYRIPCARSDTLTLLALVPIAYTTFYHHRQFGDFLWVILMACFPPPLPSLHQMSF